MIFDPVFRVFISASLIAMIVAQPLLCRAQLAAISRSVAVQPLLDGDADDDSREAASAIGAALRVSTPHHIIDSEMSAKVVGYQDKKGDASAGARAAANSLEAAKEHYFAFRYKDARAELDRAISILRPMPPGPESGMLLVDAYITQAMTAKSMRDDAGAREACAAALLIHPALEISGSEYPPSLVSIFDGARKNLRAAPTGSLALRSKPPAAEVFINGILRGVTPLEIADLPAGNYSLLIRANKYKQDERIVTIESGKRLAVDEKLKWAKGKEGGVGRAAASAQEVEEGLRVADALKADRAIMVDADTGAKGAVRITARTVDRDLRAGQRAIVIKELDGSARNAQLAEMVAALADQLDVDILSDPAKNIEPLGQGDPVILGKRKQPLTRRPAFWVAVGTAAAGAIVGGILAAMSGGPGTGSLKVEFK